MCLLWVPMMNNHSYGSKVPPNPNFGDLNRHFNFKPHNMKNSNSYIFGSVYQIDIKFDRQLRPATGTSWVVSYGAKIIPGWRTAAILKIDISPYLSEQQLSYRNQIARQLRTQYVEGINRPKYYTVTLKSRLRVTQGHWKRNHCTDHTRLTISRVIWRQIL